MDGLKWKNSSDTPTELCPHPRPVDTRRRGNAAAASHTIASGQRDKQVEMEERMIRENGRVRHRPVGRHRLHCLYSVERMTVNLNKPAYKSTPLNDLKKEDASWKHLLGQTGSRLDAGCRRVAMVRAARRVLLVQLLPPIERLSPNYCTANSHFSLIGCFWLLCSAS